MLKFLFFTLGCIFTYVFLTIKNRLKPNNDNRKGLYSTEYTATDRFGKNEDFCVMFEIEEIDSTDTKSKIKVLNVKTNKSEYNNSIYRGKLKSMVDESWVESSSIEWIQSVKRKRQEKIDKILN